MLKFNRGFGASSALLLFALTCSLSGLRPSALPQEASASPSLGETDLARTNTEADLVAAYARYCYALYGRCVAEAEELRAEIRGFCAEPSQIRLERARAAWLAARDLYARTETLRFYDGPIDNARDGVETFLNAWPLDELYIDAPGSKTTQGIIQNEKTYPNLVGAALTAANERGGEANVAIGWHAIEYLLWGIDSNPKGPGKRAHTDFCDGQEPHAARRRTYLLATADLLVAHLRQVRKAWTPGESNYRHRFETGDAKDALRKILAGMIVLSGFEMAGERLAVAYETRDQEQEHSCFSDNTHRDFIGNQRGMLDLYRGEGFAMRGVGLKGLARKLAPKLSLQLDKAMADTEKAMAALPVPFDQGILGKDETPSRRAVLAAIEALEFQTEVLAALALELGFEIPVEPGAGR
jgi:putative iron-regulated protein